MTGERDPESPAGAEAAATQAHVAITLAIVFVGLLGRSAVDKILLLRDGAAAVARWGQMGSYLDLIVGSAAAGIGNGLAILVARADPDQRGGLLRTAVRLGTLISATAGLAFSGLAIAGGRLASTIGLTQTELLGGAALACGATAGAILGSYWVGIRDLRSLLAFTVGAAACSVATVAGAPAGIVLLALAGAQALPAVIGAVLILRRTPRNTIAAHPTRRRLLKFLPAGLAAGFVGPLSMLAARAIVASSDSWQDAAQLQALWRVSDWVTNIAGGVLGILFLPRMSSAIAHDTLTHEMRRAAQAVLPASVTAFAVLYLARKPVFLLLYGPSLQPDAATTALFFGGALARIVSWIPLSALYAQGRALTIAASDFASLPFFASMLALGHGNLTPQRIGALWLGTYLLYATINLLLALRLSPGSLRLSRWLRRG